MSKVNGYEISRGSYHNTSDDCINGWYIDNPNSTTIDRRGPGFSTKKEAVEAAKKLPKLED